MLIFICVISADCVFFSQTILRERKLLESKRLDLDACKSRVRKAKNEALQQAVSFHFQPTNCTLNSFVKLSGHVIVGGA